MFIFGLHSTSDDRPSDPSKKCWPKHKKQKRPRSHRKIKCSFLDYIQLLMIGWVIWVMNGDWNAKRGLLSHQKWNVHFLMVYQKTSRRLPEDCQKTSKKLPETTRRLWLSSGSHRKLWYNVHFYKRLHFNLDSWCHWPDSFLWVIERYTEMQNRGLSKSSGILGQHEIAHFWLM